MPGTKGNKSDKKSATKDSRRERSNNFQAFVKMALETLLGSCRRFVENKNTRMRRYNIQHPNVIQWLVQLSSDHFWTSTLELNTEPRYVRWSIANALNAMLITYTHSFCRARNDASRGSSIHIRTLLSFHAITPVCISKPEAGRPSSTQAVEADPGTKDDSAHKVYRSRTLLPQQQIDEHSDGEEGASHGRVAAQEEEEVAEKAEKDHPDHMKLKEQVESVETSCYCAQVFHKRREA
ncbi:hypothetical protein EYF80_014909 [Liparis tanakae]|uniref:Uncharacterized protein n=1 Tax=Liparis tanakae TaxID=230148 RepID=A0A4Z2I9P3_9TELE|nr:hypothetical protein EYF80_014909 [Liparis tanakae]